MIKLKMILWPLIYDLVDKTYTFSKIDIYFNKLVPPFGLRQVFIGSETSVLIVIFHIDQDIIFIE